MNGVGFFGHFSSDACRHLYLVAPLFKVLQALSSQLVLFHRTYTISQKSAWIGIFLSLMVLASVPALLFANIFKRQYIMTPEHNCTSGNDSGTRVAWIHYVICMVFDVATTGIASMYLWRYTREFKRLRVYLRRLIYEGLGYFILLTAVNILNIVVFRGASVDNQSSGFVLLNNPCFKMRRPEFKQRLYWIHRDVDNESTSPHSSAGNRQGLRRGRFALVRYRSNKRKT